MSELNMLDNMVEEYGMNVYLCPHSSKHSPKGEGVSDVLYSTWDQFVVRGIANNEFGMSYSDIEDWGPVECRRFYQENLLAPDGSLKLAFEKHCSSENRALASQVSNFTQHAQIVWRWRFTQGYALINYRARVDKFLSREIGSRAKEGQSIVKSINRYLAAVKELRGDADKVLHASVSTPRLEKLLNHVLDNLKLSDLVEMGILDEPSDE